MKILHFSALDGGTGAGVAAARLHLGLLARGVDSRLCVAYPSANLEGAFTPQLGLLGRANRVVSRTIDDWIVRNHAPPNDYVLSSGRVGFDIGRIAARERPDIVQLHWIGGSSFRLASLAGIGLPVVWRLSDMWPFCGLEHLQPDAGNYVLPPKPGFSLDRLRLDASERVRRRKQAIYRSIRRLRLVAPSRWLAAEAGRSALFGEREIDRIPTSVDTALFAPMPQAACRAVLRLASDRFVVLVGATSMATRWKGADLFAQALTRVAGELVRGQGATLQVVTFGRDPPPLDGAAAVEHLGTIGDRRLMPVLYSAADVFVAPSRMENLANTVLEALASGTPAVAFDIGGMPDMIEHRRNGYLATPFDTESLADGILWAIERRGDSEISAAARAKITSEFSIDLEVGRYLDLYGKLLAACDT